MKYIKCFVTVNISIDTLILIWQKKIEVGALKTELALNGTVKNIPSTMDSTIFNTKFMAGKYPENKTIYRSNSLKNLTTLNSLKWKHNHSGSNLGLLCI